MRQKEDLEQVIKSEKQEIITQQRKAQDYYEQLISTKENFQILHNE